MTTKRKKILFTSILLFLLSFYHEDYEYHADYEIISKDVNQIMLIMINSLKWKNKDVNFDERLIDMYSSIHPKRAKGLLSSLLRIKEVEELTSVEDVLYKGFGNAEMIKNMKKLMEVKNNTCQN